MVKHPDSQTKKVQLRFSEEIAPGIYLIAFQRDFTFRAGQVIGIALEENGPRRLYSICSGENEEEIRILYKVMDEGYLTPQLSDLDAGDEIWITAPGGEFLAGKEAAVWIGTGTGIAPYYSMLRSGQAKGITLVGGQRYLEMFHFYAEFREALGENYIRCCSAEEGMGVFHGRVTQYLETMDWLDPDSKYYLCGSAEMVVECRDILIAKGIPFSQIISEIYF